MASTTPRYLPFVIRFDVKGNAVLFDEKGNKIRPTTSKLPVDVSQFQNIQSIGSVQVRGCEDTSPKKRAALTHTCYTYITCNGKLYKVPYPC